MHDDEEQLLRSVAIQNASSILHARQRAEQELLGAKEALEKKTAELADSLAMLRATLESTTDAILVTNEAGEITGSNAKYVQLWQIPPALLKQGRHRPLLLLASQLFDQPEQFIARVEQIFASAPSESFDLLELNDGRVIERFSRVQQVEGRNTGRIWSFRDITDHRRVEDALRDESRILELLNESGASLAAKLDLQGLLQAVTDAGTQLSGAKFGAFFYTAQDGENDAFMLYTLSGAPREAFEKFGHPRATALFGPTFHGHAPIRCEDVLQDPRYGKMGPHHGMPSGHLPVRSYLAVSVISRVGDVMGGLFFGHPQPGVFTERTERIITGIAAQAAVALDNARLYEASQQAAEERTRLLESERLARAEAERMSAMKDEFLATLSHELRTPLSAILGWSQILRRGAASGADFQKGIETIERNARIQRQLIEDLLDMNRITSGKVRLDMQPIEPVSFIDAAIETVRPAADAKGIRIEKTFDADVGPVSGDPNRLQQVIWNLLSNAIKFTPKNGAVTVQVKLDGAQVAIEVSDTGIGIAPDFLPHVFDRFRQADASSTRRYGGLGLGLSIVKHLVELHGGTVHAASLGADSGSRFTILLLPMTRLSDPYDEIRVRMETQQGDTLQRHSADLSGLKVLVVDDEADARELIRRVLQECGAEVYIAGTAGEALLLMQTRRPDVLISDLGMPDVDGFELLRRVRAMEMAKGRPKTSAIALTAFARSEDRTKALHAGFLAHVAKPVELYELMATVASVAGRTGE